MILDDIAHTNVYFVKTLLFSFLGHIVVLNYILNSLMASGAYRDVLSILIILFREYLSTME